VHDLGILLDSELTMKQHHSQVARSCFYQLRRLRQICRYTGQDVAMQLVCALILSRLDYCDSVLAGLPKSTLAILLHVQNAAARLILELRLYYMYYISDALHQLQWLPVDHRIQFKLCVLMHSAHTNRCPKYLIGILKPAAKYCLQPDLRSSTSKNYILPCLHSRLGERAFAYASPLA